MVESLLSMFKTLGSIFVSREKNIHSIKNQINNKFMKSGHSGFCTCPMCTQDSFSKYSLVVSGLVAMWEFSFAYLSSCTLRFMYFFCVCVHISRLFKVMGKGSNYYLPMNVSIAKSQEDT